ncbi:hypothetical protein JZ751_021317, partial [Albula glossodonta]
MDSLAKEAVNKICKLASEECAVLRLEASQSQSEIGALKRKLELKEQELRTAQGGGAGERPVNTQSVGVQVGCEFGATGREEGQSHSVSLWGDSGLTDVEEEVSPLQCVVMMVEYTFDVENRPVDFGAYAGEKAVYRESSTLTENTGGQKAVATSNSDIPIKDECPMSRKHFKKTKNSQSEIGALKRKLELKEQELRTAQGGGAGERAVNTQSVGVQTADVEDRIESIIIKVEGLEEDSESRELEEGLDLTEEGCVSFGTDAAEKLPVVRQECVEECRIPAESAEGKLPPAESDSNIKDKNRKVCSVKRVKKANGTKTCRRGGKAEKPFSCTHCRKSFGKLLHLKAHQIVHNVERPYSCTQCGKGFTAKRGLKLHMLVHTGEKPYSCAKCGTSFHEKSLLKKHQLVHTGEKPFSCDICGKNFNRAYGLKTHQIVHTREKAFNCD